MILILGGTSEARDLAAQGAAQGLPGLVSLAGATRAPAPHALPVRSGGFGGDAGFAAWLDDNPVDAVINATHPFAAAITARTARICAARGLPCLRLERPGWTPGPGDNWVWADDLPTALTRLPPGARTFCATGRQSLPLLAVAPGATFLRVIDPPHGPYPYDGDWIIARPPFDIASETALLQRLSITHLLVKDSGGAEGRTKLDAARILGLPVLMIRRPAPPPGPRAATTAVTLKWLNALLSSLSHKYPGGPGAAPPGVPPDSDLPGEVR